MPIIRAVETHFAYTRFREVSPRELQALLQDGAGPRLIDVREAWEREIAAIDGAEPLPLSEIRNWWHELDKAAQLVFFCHHGRRSAAVCQALTVEGFTDVINLRGGIEAWRLDVDPDLPAY